MGITPTAKSDSFMDMVDFNAIYAQVQLTDDDKKQFEALCRENLEPKDLGSLITRIAYAIAAAFHNLFSTTTNATDQSKGFLDRVTDKMDNTFNKTDAMVTKKKLDNATGKLDYDLRNSGNPRLAQLADYMVGVTENGAAPFAQNNIYSQISDKAINETLAPTSSLSYNPAEASIVDPLSAPQFNGTTPNSRLTFRG